MTKRVAFAFFAVVLIAISAGATDFDQAERRRERQENLYAQAMDALDDQEWRRAADLFGRVAARDSQNADAALYWKAHAQNQMGLRSEALVTLVDLQKRFPNSKWTSDGRALEVEIRQSAGQRVEPDAVTDEDLKLMVLHGLMNSSPEQAIPVLEKIINGNQSAKLKEKAIFVLSQSSSPKASEILGRLARDASRPELQARAIKYLGIMGGDASRQILADVYGATTDVKVKKSILRSYMINGDRSRLYTLARSEQNPELREEAVKQLGVMGARNELADLYASESNVDVKKKIIHSMFIGGNADKLGELARGEKNPALRVAAIKNLGLMGKETGPTLLTLYESDLSPEVRRAVINGLFLQSNARALIALARKEKDPELKKQIVSKLSLIGSKESTEFLLEILND